MILITYDFEVSFFLNPRLTKNHILEQKRISIYTAYAFIFINTIAGCKYDNTKVGFYISNLINVKSKALGR